MMKPRFALALGVLPILASVACGQADPQQGDESVESAMTPEEKKPLAEMDLWIKLWGKTGGSSISEFIGFLKGSGLVKNFLYVRAGSKIDGKAELYLNGELFTKDPEALKKLKEIFNVTFEGGAFFEGGMWVIEWKDSIVLTPEQKEKLKAMKEKIAERIKLLESKEYDGVDEALRSQFKTVLEGLDAQLAGILAQTVEGVAVDGTVVAFGQGDLSAKLLILALSGKAKAWGVFQGGGISSEMSVAKFLELIKSFTPAGVLDKVVPMKTGALTPAPVDGTAVVSADIPPAVITDAGAPTTPAF